MTTANSAAKDASIADPPKNTAKPAAAKMLPKKKVMRSGGCSVQRLMLAASSSAQGVCLQQCFPSLWKAATTR